MDHFQLLGLVPGPHDEGDIRKAYKQAALKHHPDRGGDPEMFKRVKEAYDALMQPGHAKKYTDFMRKVARLPKGKTVTQDLPITLEKLYSGCTIKFNIQRERVVPAPNFSFCGQAKYVCCAACDGRGFIERRFGRIIRPLHCANCKRTGMALAPGATIQRKKTMVQITIPKGAVKDTRMVLQGESDEKPGFQAGDICFRIREKPHEVYTRRGSGLRVKHEITLKQALTGGTLSIPHISGTPVSYTLENVVRQGEVIKIEGKGMPIAGSTLHGCLHVEMDVAFPTTLSDEQKEALRNIL